MKLWFLNLEERFKDLPEVRARRFPSRFRVPPAGEAARHVFPDGESGPNMDTCPSMTFVFISHLLDDPDLFHKKAGAGAGQTGPRPGHRQSWHGLPPQMISTGGSFAPSSLVMSPTWTMLGK